MSQDGLKRTTQPAAPRSNRRAETGTTPRTKPKTKKVSRTSDAPVEPRFCTSCVNDEITGPSVDELSEEVQMILTAMPTLVPIRPSTKEESKAFDFEPMSSDCLFEDFFF